MNWLSSITVNKYWLLIKVSVSWKVSLEKLVLDEYALEERNYIAIPGLPGV